MDSNPPFYSPNSKYHGGRVMTALIMFYTMTKTHNNNLNSYHQVNLQLSLSGIYFNHVFHGNSMNAHHEHVKCL